MTVLTEPVRRLLADRAEAADRGPEWPDESWAVLGRAGVLRAAVPSAFGGAGLGPGEALDLAEALAGACLTTAFALSQRDAAVRRLLAGPPDLRADYLPRLAAGQTFLTVGLSQLTTSRQHGGPALRATPDGGGYRLAGDVPWVTGADRAAAVVAGATLPDGAQLLAVLPTDRAGVSVGPPLDLAALRGSRTAGVRCDGVRVGPADVLAGPAEHVLGRTGGGGLETSALALGLAGAAIDLLHAEAGRRTDLAAAAEKFEAARVGVRRRLHGLAGQPAAADAVLAARAESTRLALRATQAALVAAKGAGFVPPHPAQRWARQALFFLVWSCPRPVSADLLADLTPV